MKKTRTGNGRRGYCEIYCFSSFRLVVMPNEKRAIREAYERKGTRAAFVVFHELTSALSFPYSSYPRRDRLLSVSPASFLRYRYRFDIFRSTPTRLVIQLCSHVYTDYFHRKWYDQWPRSLRELQLAKRKSYTVTNMACYVIVFKQFAHSFRSRYQCWKRETR